MDIERVQRNANLDNSGVFNPQLIIPTTFRDCLTYEQQIVFLFRMKQNKLIEGDNITLTDNGDGTVTISADGGSSSGATYELVSATPDAGYSSAYILENTDTGEQSGVKIQIPEVEDGVGITSITFDSAVAGGNQYDVNLTDGTSYQIVAPKGAPGTNGDNGDDGVGISSITFDQAVAGGNQYNVNLTDGTSYQIVAPKGDAGTGIPAITPTTDQGKVLTVNSSDQAEWETPSGGVPAITPSTDRGKVLAVNNSDQAEWTSKEFVPSHSGSSYRNKYLISNASGNLAWDYLPITAIDMAFTTSAILSQATDYAEITLSKTSGSYPENIGNTSPVLFSVSITDGSSTIYVGQLMSRQVESNKNHLMVGQLRKVNNTSSGWMSDSDKIFTDVMLYVKDQTTPVKYTLRGKYIDCTNPPSELPTITPTTDQGKVLTVNSSDQAVWGTPSGGSFEYTDQYGLPSNIPQIKFGCQVTTDELTLGTRYYVTLGPEYMPDPSGQEEPTPPTPGSLENGEDLFDYVSDNSISAPGVVVPVNFPRFDLYYYDSSEDEYREFAQLAGGTWTATGFYDNGNAYLNIEGIFRSSGADKFVYLRLQLKSSDGLTWSSYNSTACSVTPLLGTFRAM